MRSPKKALDDIKIAKKIAIFCHINPDADALASCVAIKKLIKLNLVDPDEPKIIDIFFDYEEISELNGAMIKGVETNIQNCDTYDIALCVDCSNVDRLGKYKDLFLSTENTINFDHHITNEEFAYNNLVLKKASSTCEVLYTLAKTQNMQISDAREKEEARLKQEKFMRMKTEMEEDRKQAVENKKQRKLEEQRKDKELLDLYLQQLKMDEEKDRNAYLARRQKEKEINEYRQKQMEDKKEKAMYDFNSIQQETFNQQRRLELEKDDFLKFAGEQIANYKAEGKNILPMLMELKYSRKKGLI